jgi:prepilin-type N-terminal cleavage/methylation domain-containing protein
MSKRQSQQGFTLIEVMLALMIMGLIMVGLYSTLNTTLKTREMLQREVKAARLGPELLDVIIEDLRRAWTLNIADDTVFKGEARTQLGESADTLSFLSTVDSTTTYRVGNREVSADLVETGYRLRPNPELPDVLELYRRQSFHIDDKPLEDGTYQLLHDRVVAFEVRYYEDRVLAHDPLEDWEAEDRHALPAMISIELGIEVGPRSADTRQLLSKDSQRTRWYRRMLMLDPGAAAAMRIHPHAPTFSGATTAAAAGSGGAGDGQDDDGNPDGSNPDGSNPDGSGPGGSGPGGSDVDLGNVLDELFGGNGD